MSKEAGVLDITPSPSSAPRVEGAEEDGKPRRRKREILTLQAHPAGPGPGRHEVQGCKHAAGRAPDSSQEAGLGLNLDSAPLSRQL